MNDRDEVVQTTRSEFDGFYLFELVPLGKYRVRLSPPQLNLLSLTAPAGEEVVLINDEPVISGIDFTVSKSVER